MGEQSQHMTQKQKGEQRRYNDERKMIEENKCLDREPWKIYWKNQNMLLIHIHIEISN